MIRSLRPGLRAGIAVVCLLFAAAFPGAAVAADGPEVDDLLSATLLDPIEAGRDARVGVHWKGESEAILEASVDGRPAQRTRVEPGVEVLTIRVPEGGAPRELQLTARGADTGPEPVKLGVAADNCRWADHFVGPEPDATIFASAVFDDGSGPKLYVGGTFRSVGNRIAAWDGTDWIPLRDVSTGEQGVSGSVRALAVHDDGSGAALYVGGSFTSAGGTTASNVAKWDGSNWVALTDTGTGQQGTDSEVSALTSHDDGSGPALYAGGFFFSAGGVSTTGVARWNGANWSPLTDVGTGQQGADSQVRAIVEHDDGSGPALYVGGDLFSAGGDSVNNIARWDGANWTPLTDVGTTIDGVNSTVVSLAVFDDGTGAALYVGGHFFQAGGNGANRVARWDGSNWSPLTDGTTAVDGTDGGVYTLRVHDDGTGPALWAGGFFTNAGGNPASRLARWNGVNWTAPPGTDSDINTLTEFDDGGGTALYAGGLFDMAGPVDANRIARWDGVGWMSLTGVGPDYQGLNSTVIALAAFDDGSGPALYVGGFFTEAGGAPISRIARWDGTGWSALTSTSTGQEGLSAAVEALAVFDDGTGAGLYAGGQFSTAGGVAASGIARWDGTDWAPVGSGTNGTVEALVVHDDGTGPALYAGGAFTNAGGIPVNFIARWDGAAWSALGSGLNSAVLALETFDDGTGASLYAGGVFTTAGGVTANRVAEWDGAAWSALTDAGTGQEGTNNNVFALRTFDDGFGDDLYMGGAFSSVAGVGANRMARWDGTNWTTLNGLGTVRSLGVHDDGSGPALYAGGDFSIASGSPSNRIARWDGSSWSGLVDSQTGGDGLGDAALALLSYDDGSGQALWAGGNNGTAGGRTSSRIASYRCVGAPCAGTTPLHLDDFESGDFSAWDVVRNPQGDLAVEAGAALADAFGLRIHLDHSASRNQLNHYVLKTHADVPNYCFSLLFDPNSISMPNNRLTRFFGALGNDNRRLLAMALRNVGGEYRVGLQAYKDGFAAASVGFHPIPDGPVLLGGEWAQTSGAGNDGVLRLFIDGFEVAALTNIDNMTRALRTPGVGSLGSYRKPTLGDLFVDAFVSGWTAP